MLNIIAERERKIETYYCREFTNNDGGGFTFPCDSEGKLEPFTNEGQRVNYEYAMSHPEKFPVEFNRIRRYECRYTENARGVCSCGEEIELYDYYQGACPCPKCGQWYNLFGQELISPEFWEED